MKKTSFGRISISAITPKIPVFKFFCLLLLPFAFSSCTNSKQLAYFKDLADTTKVVSVGLYPYQPLILQNNDQVQIIISSQSSEATQFFNLMTSVAVSGVAGVSAERTFQNVYAVASNGTITLPVLGDIPVAGLTTEELKQKLIVNLNEYLKDPIVSVRITNFKVTVIGEVSRPVVIPVDGEKINVLQALGLAGDMTVYGTRATVKVMRNINDSMQVAHLNFNSANQLLQSPFFQLHQNDVVYVTPVSNKGTRTENVAIWLPVILSILTTITLVIWRLKA